MKTLSKLFCIVLATLALNAMNGSDLYRQASDYLGISPAAFESSLSGLANPASPAFLFRPDMSYAFIVSNYSPYKTGNQLLSLSVFGSGASIEYAGDYWKYTLSSSYRIGWAGFGFGYYWRNTDFYGFGSGLSLGFMAKPAPFVSFGMSGFLDYGNKFLTNTAALDIAVRPFGSGILSLFADYSYTSADAFPSQSWSAGVILEPLDGISLTARYRGDRTFSFGAMLNLGAITFGGNAQYADTFKHQCELYTVRIGGGERSALVDALSRRSVYVSLDLRGELQYRREWMFDRTKRLSDILERLDDLRADDRVAGVVVNIGGMTASRGFYRELREKFIAVKNAGKRVIVTFDTVDLQGYLLASAADTVVIDPCGQMYLPGVVLGNNYFKGLLDKLGIGVSELRFLAYKSAAESFVRTNMSDADREQRAAYVASAYADIKKDIAAARHITPEAVDAAVNDGWILSPETALSNKFADRLGRFTDAADIVSNIEGRPFAVVPAWMHLKQKPAEEMIWGAKPSIAVIYALGACEMESGINALKLRGQFERAMNDTTIRAVVFRVDSPGGLIIPSDIVADAVKKCRAKKPVVVSMGAVAGSGGYWISMNANRIIAQPDTITGSIGVIGSWLYDKGAGEKLGITVDSTSAGKHASLDVPMLVLPTRDLNADERELLMKQMKSYYQVFVSKVAAARGKSADDVEKIARGRIYSGRDALAIGLVDELGGMETAVAAAKKIAGIGPSEICPLTDYEDMPFSMGMMRRMLTADLPEMLTLERMIKQASFFLKNANTVTATMPIDLIGPAYFTE
ncbi:MAG: signal peptide peptidase SppA [Spirochaetes bacterium]|nr:signal peptide peptidase SppA [Spirochaetota bacterium]